jgi:hypothetical protein
MICESTIAGTDLVKLALTVNKDAQTRCYQWLGRHGATCIAIFFILCDDMAAITPLEQRSLMPSQAVPLDSCSA